MVDPAWWATEPEALFTEPGSAPAGLPSAEAGPRATARHPHARNHAAVGLFVRRFTSPRALILIVGALLSLVLRTRRRFRRSAPSPLLLWSSVVVAILALGLPFVGGIAVLFAFRPLSPAPVAARPVIVLIPVLKTERARRGHAVQGD